VLPLRFGLAPRPACRRAAISEASAKPHQEGSRAMGKGNNSQKNDKKNKKPKQDKTKAAPKK
jgi:hypothetical protein